MDTKMQRLYSISRERAKKPPQNTFRREFLHSQSDAEIEAIPYGRNADYFAQKEQ